jgi:hypothetical protein
VLALTRIGLGLLKQFAMYLRDGTRLLLDEIPYRRSYGVQTLICAAAKVKDHRLSAR